MQLLSMEVNQSAAGDRLQVSTLAPGVNAVCGRRGSGKTSLLRWLRGMIQTSLVDSSPAGAPAARFDGATGRIRLRIGDLEYELERGQPSGTISSKVLRRATSAWSGADGSPGNVSHVETLSRLQCEAFDLLAAIPSDSRACDRLREVARQLNLDLPSRPQFADERLRLSTREQELIAQLQPLEGLTSTREGLMARRRQLESDLDRARRDSIGRHYAPTTDEHHRLSDRLSVLRRDAQKLRDEIAELDAAMLNATRAPATAGQTHARSAQEISYRERLVALDAQLARWRSTLSEIRTHRERLEALATDAQLNGQLGEQFSPINQATPRLALRALEAQIVEARRHFDALLEGVDRYRSAGDDARNELPQTLRLMQRELHEVCQQLSRHESLTSNRATQEQILQLSRCESEMRIAIERLISERGELLRSIATACHLSADQVTVAFSDNCRCADHPALDAWLNAISPPGAAALSGSAFDQVPAGMLHSLEATASSDQLGRIASRRSAAVLHLQDCEREERETENRLHRLGVAPVPAALEDRVEADLLRQLDEVAEELLRLETRDRLRVDLNDVRRRLQQLPREEEDSSSFRGRYLMHAAGLTGRNLDAPRGHWVNGNGDTRALELDIEQRLGRLHEIALRLAIVELLAAGEAGIPLVLDQTLDQLDGPQRLTAVRYLASVCESRRVQVVALTEDPAVAETIKAARGTVVPMIFSRTIPAAPAPYEFDVNRQLLAYANDFEADKWGQPDAVRATSPRGDAKRPFVLTERSQIEDVPSIGPLAAARLRALGIDRVADLLDSDHHWIADNARLDGITADTILAWQSEASLLCAMPQLRPFDARVLAGAGVRDQRQLAEMHPSRLLERVERFLATERGRQIMRSGSTYELSRITAWIASAKRGGSQSHSDEDVSTEPPFGVEPDSRRRSARRGSFQRNDQAHDSTAPYHIVQRDDAQGTADGQAPRGGRRPRRDRPDRLDRADRPARAAYDERPTRGGDSDRQRRGTARGGQGGADHFHLELNSPVVDAPSIGASMAGQLETLGVRTVADLLAADVDRLARDLGVPRINGVVIRNWQDQARLVCRIPNLRGHDAQILVGCGVTSPEALAQLEPAKLLAQATGLAQSPKGQRILRGSQAPDLAEVTDWIQWSGHSRTLRAA